jgi:hypothetical protein
MLVKYSSPEGGLRGGRLERFFATVQSQFEGEARAGPILTLDQLNRAILRWALAGILFPIQEPSRRKES